jgi:hypothetical protein
MGGTTLLSAIKRLRDRNFIRKQPQGGLKCVTQGSTNPRHQAAMAPSIFKSNYSTLSFPFLENPTSTMTASLNGLPQAVNNLNNKIFVSWSFAIACIKVNISFAMPLGGMKFDLCADYKVKRVLHSNRTKSGLKE